MHIAELISLYPDDIAEIGKTVFPRETWERLLMLRAFPDDLTECWKVVLNNDQRNEWRSALTRVLVLTVLVRAFEYLDRENHKKLQVSFTRFLSNSGRRLSVTGTKCEMLSRTAETLFKEGRRKPGEHASNLMLSISESLFSIVLLECPRKDDPRFARRWYGMKGVCRMMLTCQDETSPNETRKRNFASVVADLENSFRLGNRGASAAVYLLDALIHLLEYEKGDALYHRVDAVIAALSDEERRNRSVLFLIGRYWFDRSFKDNDGTQSLDVAIRMFTEALTFPPFLAHDSAFVQHVRGQALIRLSMAAEESDFVLSTEKLNDGINDLKYSFESSPEKYGKQKSLPSALLTRAKIHSRAKQYELARQDIRYILGHIQFSEADPASRLAAEFELLQNKLKEALDSDDMNVAAGMLRLLLSHPECKNQACFLAGIAAKKIFANKSNTDDPILLIDTVSAMEVFNVGKILDPSNRRAYLSMTAGLMYMLGLTWQTKYLESAWNKYVEAITSSSMRPAAELLSLYADCSLRRAKNYLQIDDNDERAADLLEIAGESFAQAAELAERQPESVSDKFRLVVTYSKAGEAFLRLCGLTASIDDGKKAVHFFDCAKALGNNSHELMGLQGDSYYRLYKLTKHPEFLEKAVTQKRLARGAGGDNRENLSLSAKLAFMQWEMSGNKKDLVSAIDLVAEAHNRSPLWPWPPFQLSEILNKVGVNLFREIITERVLLGTHSDLLNLIKDEPESALVNLACRLVIDNDEFVRKKLGGRQPVYVLQDPHRLLSSSYVFKHTKTTNALRERKVIMEFSEFLGERGLQSLRLPKPLAIIEQQDKKNVVYVMRLAKGCQLGRLVIRERNSYSSMALKEFERAIGYLAAFHAWGKLTQKPTQISIYKFVCFFLNGKMKLHDMKFHPDTHRLLSDLGKAPCMIKKDAHPENWLIDDFGHITMLDFESSKAIPVFFDVVQLIDDYPLLKPDVEGWTCRMSLCKEYLSRVGELSEKSYCFEQLNVEILYGIFAVLRCSFGLRCTTRRHNTPSSSVSLRSRDARLTHYSKTLEFLRIHHPHTGVREFAHTMSLIYAAQADR